MIIIHTSLIEVLVLQCPPRNGHREVFVFIGIEKSGIQLQKQSTAPSPILCRWVGRNTSSTFGFHIEM